MKYRNPIISGFNPDPSICYAKKNYYIVTSSFEYFPGVPIYKSQDLFQWKLVGHCLTRKSQLDLSTVKSSQGIFAPTIRFIKNKFYMVTTCVGGCGHFYVSADDPEAEWSDPVYIDGDGFDPDFFEDVDGTVYFTRQNMAGGIIQFKIDLMTGRLLSEGKIIWKGFEDVHCEGPHIYRIGEWYYLLAAEGGTHIGHMCVIGRCKQVDGVYTAYDKNPILSHRGKTDSLIKALGHGDFIKDIFNKWWIVFLGIRQVGNWEEGFWHNLGRETFLAPVYFNDDGWPVVYNEHVIELEMEIDVTYEPEICNQIANRKTDEISFYSRGNQNSKVTQIINNQMVEIQYLKDTLNTCTLSNALFIKQKHFDFSFEARIIGEPRSSQEFGLTVFMNESHHYDIAFASFLDKHQVFVRKVIGDIKCRTHEYQIECNAESLKLFIEGNRMTYELGIVINNERTIIGKGMTKYLSSEVAAGFTGVFLGIYASGNGIDFDDKAIFKEIHYANKVENDIRNI